MTGMSRFCVTTFFGAISCVGFAASDLHGQTRLMAGAEAVPPSELSSALSGQLPPGRYGGYQYQGAFPSSRLDRGLQYAGPTADDSAQAGVVTDPTAIDWEHTPTQQVQYPLSEPDYEEIEDQAGPSPGRVPPHWAPPILATPSHSPAAEADGWGLKAQVPSDLTHVFGSGNTLGITTVTTGVILESSRRPGASLRPRFGWHFPHGPTRTDLPGQLYDASVEARMYWPFRDNLIGEFALAPSIFSDFENTSSDALRIVGRGVGYYVWSPNLKFAAGVTYLDRKDIQLLPIAGIIWTPTPDHRLDLVFPQPRIARRFRKDDQHERWVYLSGELGGGSWAIQRSTGVDDVVSYRDLRLITGIEWKFAGETSFRFEGGYVFGRELEYVSNVGNYQPRSTTMLRATFAF